MHEPPPDDLTALHRALLHAEGSLEPRMARLRARLGLDRPRCLIPYRSFATPDGLEVHGRLLASEPAEAHAADRWWDHLAHTYRRWNTRELPGVEVRLRHGANEVVAITDDEGDYRAVLPAPALGDALTWHQVFAVVACEDGWVEATHDVLWPGHGAKRLLLSDVDDTILHTGATNGLRMAWHSFTKSAHFRTALPGIAPLYRGLVGDTEPVNPLAFVSSSPRNLYDLLLDFMALHEVPPAPILLRDVGLDATKIVKTKGHRHKLDRIEEVMARYPSLPVVLLGDTGQHDAQLYAEAVARHGRRIEAVYLRDVDPHEDTPRDVQADVHGAAITEAGVAYVRGDSLAFAEHALSRGWLTPSARDAVRASVM